MLLVHILLDPELKNKNTWTVILVFFPCVQVLLEWNKSVCDWFYCFCHEGIVSNVYKAVEIHGN